MAALYSILFDEQWTIVSLVAGLGLVSLPPGGLRWGSSWGEAYDFQFAKYFWVAPRQSRMSK
jgi:hypothetical protein